MEIAKVYFIDGEVIQGRISVWPKEQDNGFYLSPMNGGSLFNKKGRIFIGLAAVKKIEFKF